MRHLTSELKTFLSLSFLTFLTLILVFLGLPALFLILKIPSFEISVATLWILRWQNNTEGSGIHFNLVALLIIAVLVGLIGLVIRLTKSRF
jgi:hypothetical protein